MTTLVTGGCGYIGSHIVRLLIQTGKKVVILDDFSTGYRELHVAGAELITGDCRDEKLVDKIFEDHKVDSVIHCAASIIVPESVAKPVEYYHNNILSTLNLVRAVRKYQTKSFIFSSTAAVYGDAGSEFVDESAPFSPESPYGKSKVCDEWIIQDAASVSKFKYAIIRYFNVAGASSDLSIGPLKDNATHLVRVASEFATGKRSQLNIYGSDYSTSDGTAVRDYIHIEDIAQAHLDCLSYLEKGGASDVFNCGYGKGYSVKEVIDEFSRVLNRPLKYEIKPRRDGDVERIVANSNKIRKVVGWKPKYEQLSAIIKSAVAWEEKTKKS